LVAELINWLILFTSLIFAVEVGKAVFDSNPRFEFPVDSAEWTAGLPLCWSCLFDCVASQLTIPESLAVHVMANDRQVLRTG
jgi:hypothetical protein